MSHTYTQLSQIPCIILRPECLDPGRLVLTLSKDDAAALVAFGQDRAEEQARQKRMANCAHSVIDVDGARAVCRDCGAVGQHGPPATPQESGAEQNIRLLFATVNDIKGELGELQLKVQKLETGYRDDEEDSAICQHLRVLASATAPGYQCCDCPRHFANVAAVDAARSCAKADRDHERRNRKIVGGRKVAMNPVLAAPYGGEQVSPRQRLTHAVMAYLLDLMLKADKAACDSYNEEGKTSKTLALEAEHDTITSIHDAVTRIIKETP